MQFLKSINADKTQKRTQSNNSRHPAAVS